MDNVVYIKYKNDNDFASTLLDVLIKEPKVKIALLCNNDYEVSIGDGYKLLLDIRHFVMHSEADVIRGISGTYIKFRNGSSITSVNARSKYTAFKYDYYVNMYDRENRRWALPKWRCAELSQEFLKDDVSVEFF